MGEPDSFLELALFCELGCTRDQGNAFIVVELLAIRVHLPALGWRVCFFKHPAVRPAELDRGVRSEKNLVGTTVRVGEGRVVVDRLPVFEHQGASDGVWNLAIISPMTDAPRSKDLDGILSCVPVKHIELLGAPFAREPVGAAWIKFPVECFATGGIVARRNPVCLLMVLGSHRDRITHGVRFIKTACELVYWIRASLEPRSDHALRAASGLADSDTIVERMREWALKVHMQSGLKTFERYFLVSVC